MKNCCGKDCESCTVREAEQCPGCRHIADFGECEIVSCCKDKGHESCSTCTQQTWCPTVQKSISMPKYRREKADAEAEISRRNQDNAGVRYPEKFCVNNLPTKHGLLARHSCPFPLVVTELPEVSLVMRAAGVNGAAGFRES